MDEHDLSATGASAGLESATVRGGEVEPAWLRRKRLQKAAAKALTRAGIIPRPKVVVSIVDRLLGCGGDWQTELRRLVAVLRSAQQGKGSVADEAMLEAAEKNLSKTAADSEAEALQVIPATKVPKYRYNSVRHGYELDTRPRPLVGSAEHKIAMMTERFQLTQQRLERNDMFRPPVVATGQEKAWVQLTNLESLQGTNGAQVTVLAMITQPEEGKVALEDLHRTVPLDLSAVRVGDGLFTETSLVLVEGHFDDGVFHATGMGLPPMETREASIRALGVSDPMGVCKTPSEHAQSLALLHQSVKSRFVFLSDVYLDLPDVRENLRRLFRVLADSGLVPELIVMCGPFMSTPFGARGPHDRARLEECLSLLGGILAETPDIAGRSHLVLVPGPTDPAGPPVLPRPPLPAVFARKLVEQVSTVTLATNPCRIRFHTQEIVVFRDDLLAKMRRYAVVPSTAERPAAGATSAPPTPARAGAAAAASQDRLAASQRSVTGELPAAVSSRSKLISNLVQSILDQAHLCPVPSQVQPVYWAHDSALRLFPLPDVIVLADATDQFQKNFDRCQVFNPGSFASQRQGSFMMFEPATCRAEPSVVSPDA